MKKIMFICNSLSNGGAERVVSLLADSMERKGHEIYLLVFLDMENTYVNNPNIHILPAKRSGRAIKDKILRITEIRKNIKMHGIDTVIAFSHYYVMSAVVAAGRMPVRLIGSERNDPAQLERKPFVCRLRSFLYRFLDVLVCQTEDAKKYFSPDIQKKSAVILNPLSSGLPSPYEGDREHRIVTFCRLEKQKNLPLLIDAFEEFRREHPDYVLEIYGEGSERESLCEYAEKKKLTDCIAMFPFDRQIHQRVRPAAMFVLPSNYEGLSNSMIEALAIGLPVVVTDCPCGGARAVIKDGYNGYLVPVGDREQLVRKMKLVVEDKQKTEGMIRNSQTIRTLLSRERIVSQWMEIIGN